MAEPGGVVDIVRAEQAHALAAPDLDHGPVAAPVGELEHVVLQDQVGVRGLAAAMGHAIEGRDWSFDVSFDELPVGRELELGPTRVRSFETYHTPDRVRSDSIQVVTIEDTNTAVLAFESGRVDWLADVDPAQDWFAYVHMSDLERMWSQEPLAYKHMYHDRLWAEVGRRVEGVRSGRVDAETMRALNAAVDLSGESPEAVALDWLGGAGAGSGR